MAVGDANGEGSAGAGPVAVPAATGSLADGEGRAATARASSASRFARSKALRDSRNFCAALA